MDKTNKIIYNTGVVYAQLIISTLISLFSVRFVLQSLGEEDYGIYMLVAGVVAFLKVISTSMSNAAVRFMSHSLGKKNIEESKKTFNTILLIHYGLAIILVILLEVGGYVMFEFFLNIPDAKILDAKIVYQFMVVTTLVTVVSVPFDAIINAHENLLFLSILSVISSVVTLVIAVYLLYYSGDRLIMYGFLLMLLEIIMRIVKQVYTRTRYDESRVDFKHYFDKTVSKLILSFVGWDMFRTVISIGATQLRGVFINMFFGVRLNAAEGIGKKINSHLNVVSTGITRAITPQMNKSEGSGDRKRLIHLTFTGVKFTTFMYCLLAIPLMLEMDYILSVWLKEVPEFTAIFCQMCILLLMIDKFTWQIGNSIRAVGRIKEYQLFSSLNGVISVIAGYLVLKAGYGPISIYLIQIPFSFIHIGIRFYFGKKLVGMKPISFIKEATIPVLIPLLVALTISILIKSTMNQGFLRFFIVFAVFITIDTTTYWLFSMKSTERKRLKGIITKKLYSQNG